MITNINNDIKEVATDPIYDLPNYLTNIANAIRAAEGSTESISPQEFESRIRALNPSGNDSSNLTASFSKNTNLTDLLKSIAYAIRDIEKLDHIEENYINPQDFASRICVKQLDTPVISIVDNVLYIEPVIGAQSYTIYATELDFSASDTDALYVLTEIDTVTLTEIPLGNYFESYFLTKYGKVTSDSYMQYDPFPTTISVCANAKAITSEKSNTIDYNWSETFDSITVEIIRVAEDSFYSVASKDVETLSNWISQKGYSWVYIPESTWGSHCAGMQNGSSISIIDLAEHYSTDLSIDELGSVSVNCLYIAEDCSSFEIRFYPYEANAIVTYDCNGGNLSGETISVMEVALGDLIILPTPVRSGYIFNYWLCGDDDLPYSGGATYTVNSDVTFVASWTYDENSGGGNTEDTTYTGTINIINKVNGTLSVTYESVEGMDAYEDVITIDAIEPASKTITIPDIPIDKTLTILSVEHTDNSASIYKSSDEISYNNNTVIIEASYTD